FRLEGATLRLRGWAFDADAGEPATVRVHFDGGEGQPVASGAARPDVARAMGQPAANNAGFDTGLDASAAGGRDCAIGLSATARDGRVLWLRKASCNAAALP